jgi:hypothetical protein
MKGIYYIGQYGTCGYASAARGYLYHYFSLGLPITWHPLYFDDSVLSMDDPYNVVISSLIDKSIPSYDMVIMHSTPDLWPEFWKDEEHKLKNKIVVGYCAWETNRLPKRWVECINGSVNEVWVPSTYNQVHFQESGVTIPIRVVPHIFLSKQLPPRSQIQLKYGGKLLPNDIYTFYTIGEMNARKSIEDTVHVFCRAFTKSDSVRLIVKVHYKNYQSSNVEFCKNTINAILEQYPDRPEVILLLNCMTNDEILALHSLGDCYVSLTKSEGFGLTIFDAFNYGRKIIATGYSGHLDFLGKDYPGLVSYTLGPVEGMDGFSTNYTGEQMWAIPNLDHAIELLKFARK